MMYLLRAIWHGLGQIRAHKLRSLLSLSSVFLGVASLIAILGFINGLFTGWQVGIYESGGIEKISIVEDFLPKKQAYLKSLSKGRSLEDARAISKLCHNLSAISPEIDLDTTVIANAKTYAVRTQGIGPGTFITNRYEVAQGREITDSDLHGRVQVAVIGNTVYETVFRKGENPLGKTISINGVSFTVVGLLKKYSMMQGDWDELEGKNRIVFIPLTTMEDRFVPSKKLTWLNAEVKDTALIDQTAQEISNVLIHTHRGMKDFRIETRGSELADFKSTKAGFDFTGQAIGFVTLLIGGVGIANLMLASVSERMREIGLCKAVGASNGDIFVQILAEAVCLSAIGGMMGVGVGAATIRVLQSVLATSMFRPLFSVTAGIVGFSFSLFIGVVAGLYPAFQASRLDPIEALRYE
ncbi:MAG: ABC transporter permease [Chthoniobacteraceae bacterium]